MYPILVSIGNKLSIYSYGTCIAVGLILAIFLACKKAKKYGIDPDLFFNGGLYAFIGGIVGAKLLYVITDIKEIIEDPAILKDLGSGFVFYGGLIAGVVTFIVYVSKIKKETVLDKVDVAIPFVALAQAFGRLGCYLAGCCYGKKAPEGAWYAVVFPNNNCCAPTGVELYPVQLWSAILLVILFVIVFFAVKKEKFAGIGLSAYLTLYSIGRFLIEFLRDDPRGFIGPFSTSQFIAMFTFIAGVGSFFLFRWYEARPLKVGGYPEDMEEEEDEEEETEASEEEAAGVPEEEAAGVPEEEAAEAPEEEAAEATEEAAAEEPSGNEEEVPEEKSSEE